MATTLDQVGALLLEAARLCNHRNFVIAGSLCVLGSILRPPEDMVLSRDVDLYPKLDPGRGFEEIARELAQGSAFAREHGVYADPISPQLLSLPEGWEARLIPVPLPGGVVAWFLDPNDAAIGKLMRGEDNDLRWCRAGMREGILSLPVVQERLRTVARALPEDFERARASMALLQQPNGDPGAS